MMYETGQMVHVQSSRLRVKYMEKDGHLQPDEGEEVQLHKQEVRTNQ